jgi:hypothetical protein
VRCLRSGLACLDNEWCGRSAQRHSGMGYGCTKYLLILREKPRGSATNKYSNQHKPPLYPMKTGKAGKAWKASLLCSGQSTYPIGNIPILVGTSFSTSYLEYLSTFPPAEQVL